MRYCVPKQTLDDWYSFTVTTPFQRSSLGLQAPTLEALLCCSAVASGSPGLWGLTHHHHLHTSQFLAGSSLLTFRHTEPKPGAHVSVVQAASYVRSGTHHRIPTPGLPPAFLVNGISIYPVTKTKNMVLVFSLFPPWPIPTQSVD